MRAGAKPSELQVVPVPLTLREVEMAICGLKIWRQVIVAQSFARFMGDSEALNETLVEIDSTLEKIEKAKEKV